jgi:3',5'-cyclic AMP phosphodiesterase CpdA
MENDHNKDNFTNREKISRRDFLGVASKGAAATMIAGVFSPSVGSMIGLGGVAEAATKKVKPFTFAVMTDGHLYDIKDHRFDGMFMDAVDLINKMNPRPDMVIYCGDIGQTGLASEIAKGKRMLDQLKMPYKVIPGEHDWYLDMGKAWRGMFGDENWSFDHNGTHIIGMNSIKIDDFWTGPGLTAEQRMGRVLELECNSCGPWGVEEDGLDWLEKDVKKVSPDTPIVFFSHSPLWDYYPRWNFATKDAPEIRGLLRKFESVMAIHGHVHQVVFNKIGNISSVGTSSTSWPWPYPPVDMPYPDIRHNRLDPGDFHDGMGAHHIKVAADGSGTMFYDPFNPSMLPQAVARGVKL